MARPAKTASPAVFIDPDLAPACRLACPARPRASRRRSDRSATPRLRTAGFAASSAVVRRKPVHAAVRSVLSRLRMRDRSDGERQPRTYLVFMLLTDPPPADGG